LFLSDPDSEPFRLDVNASEGTLVAWSNAFYHETIREYLIIVIDDAKTTANYENFTHLSKIGLSQFELILGMGGAVVEPMLSGDFKTIIIGQKILPSGDDQRRKLADKINNLLADANVTVKDDDKKKGFRREAD
jgi:hypothetical protein